MAAIYEEIVLRWDGEEYTVQPSFRMAQRIEARGISIMGVVEKIHRGEPPATQIAEIIAHMLHSGGAKRATPERVYAQLTLAEPEEWLRITTAIIIGFIPQEPDQGNSGGPEDGADQTKAETETTPTEKPSPI